MPPSGMRPNQGQTKALHDRGLKVPDGTSAIVQYLGGRLRKDLQHNARALGRIHHDGLLATAHDAGSKEVILAFDTAEKVTDGLTAGGNPRKVVNPGCRNLDRQKAIYAAVLQPDLVVPDPVRGEVANQCVKVRDSIAATMASTTGHVAPVAASVEIATKASQKTFRELMVADADEVPVVAAITRGAPGWDRFTKVMDDLRHLDRDDVIDLSAKRLIVHGFPQQMPSALASYAMAALGQDARDAIMRMPRPVIRKPDEPEPDPLTTALNKRLYQRGIGDYRTVASAQANPTLFGTANIPVLTGTSTNWTLDDARDEVFRVEVTGIAADWTRARPMSRSQRSLAYPTLAGYWP